MMFQALLYKWYAGRGPISAESKGQGSCAPLKFFSPLDNLGPLIALRSNNKYSNKIIAKMLHISIHGRTIMNKFRRYLDRISAETCLNIGGSPPESRLDLVNTECAKTLLQLNISGWCRCLAILEQKETLLFYICWSPSCPKIVSPLLRELIFIDAANKFSIFLKNLIYYSQHNVLCTVLHYECYHCQTKLFSPSYLLIIFKFQ